MTSSLIVYTPWHLPYNLIGCSLYISLLYVTARFAHCRATVRDSVWPPRLGYPPGWVTAADISSGSSPTSAIMSLMRWRYFSSHQKPLWSQTGQTLSLYRSYNRDYTYISLFFLIFIILYFPSFYFGKCVHCFVQFLCLLAKYHTAKRDQTWTSTQI